MTQQQLDTRKERAETLVISQTEEGFRVYSPAHPTTSYIVSGSPEAPACTCPDFEYHRGDPEWRCKHILAVLDHLLKSGSCAPPADSGTNEERAAIRAEGSGNPMTSKASQSNGTAQMLIKRSVSPDGRIDSLSVEFSCPVEQEPAQEIQSRAERIRDLQSNVIESFLGRNGNGNGRAKAGNNGNGAIPAQMLEIAGMNGKWGRRLFITVQANGHALKLFGNHKELADVITSVGFPNLADRIAEGVRLNLPCKVITKPSEDGRYLNIERILPSDAPKPQPQRGWRQ